MALLAKAEVEGFSAQLRSAQSSGVSKAEMAALSAQSRTAYGNYLNGLIDVAYKARARLELIDSITGVIGSVFDAVPRAAGAGDAFANAVTIRRYMSRAEADALLTSGKFAQGPRSFEQHKWFFTDGAVYDPKGGSGFDCELTVTVPRGVIPKIFDHASANPRGTTEAIRYKPGGAGSVEQAEPGAFGIHRYGLDEFSRILQSKNWSIRDLKSGQVRRQ
ncbi:hypothetical protein [Chromobacterium sinusclupearum]|uniref:hypothetical protein n=1 Tax=Chromobacterium sinusclupearum TaxID=2077146 RepID=UPI0011AEE45D|nr:hypothetical protein [Chromobacterium sinusclupearum]